MTYASTTTVTAEKSREEIERTLRRYGAESFAYGWDRNNAVIQFQAENRTVKFVLPLPDRAAREFTHHSRGTRTAAAADKAWEQATRQRWRALALVIKAKLEAVEAGIVSFEDEFLAHVMLPSGQTVGEWAAPRVNDVYQLGAGTLPELGIGSGRGEA